MRIVEIKAMPNGGHVNLSGDSVSCPPDGWAMIPEGFPVPDTFPFLNEIKVEEITYYNEVKVPAKREVPVLDDEGNPVLDEEGNPLTETEDYMDTKQVPYTMMTVTSMTPGIVPEPAPEPVPEPTMEERNRADIDYLAVMMGVEL